MYKKFALYGMIFVIAIGVTAFLVLDVQKSGSDVKITEAEHTGNSDQVKNARVELIALRRDGKAVWKTESSLGEKPEAETEIIKKEEMEPYKDKHINKEDECGIMTGYGWDIIMEEMGHDEYDPEKLNENYKGLQHIYQTKSRHELRKNKVKLSELIKYYPFCTRIMINGNSAQNMVDYYLNVEPYDSALNEDDQYIAEYFGDNFKIPVQEDQMMKLSPIDNGQYTFTSMPGSDEYIIKHHDVQLQDNWYFTFNTHTEKDNVVDTEELTHGYGIYRVPLLRKENGENKAPFNIDDLENFYPLDPETEVINLAADEKGKNLFLVYYLEGKSYCSIIDIETGKEVQNILLNQNEFLDFGKLRVFDDLCILTYTENTGRWNQEGNPRYSDKKIFIMSKQKNGDYKIDFICDRLNDEGEGVLYPVDADFDGKHLITVEAKGLSFEEKEKIEGCNFAVCVYDKSGLLYYGKYQNSLSMDFEVQSDAPYIADIKVNW